MTRLKLVSTKVPDEWIQKLKESTRSSGLTQSAIVRLAIGQYLGLDSVDPVVRVDPLRSEVDEIKERLTALEELTLKLTTVDPLLPMAKDRTEVIAASSPQSESAPPPSPPESKGLKIPEVHRELVARGYKKAEPTFRTILGKSIKAQKLPGDLIALGLRADFKAQSQARSQGKTSKWLSIV